MDFQIPELRVNVDYSDQPVHPECADQAAEIWYDPDGQPCAYGYHTDNYFWMHWPGLATYRFDSTSNLVLAYPTISGREPLVEDTYSRSVLPFVLQTRGWQVIHASGVECRSGIAVFCGVSGVGKSTLQFGLTQKGYHPWADDAVAFLPGAYLSQSLRLPFRVRLLSNSIQYFQLKSPPPPAYAPLDNMENHLAPVAAVFILSRANDTQAHLSPPGITRMRPDQAFTNLLEHAYCFMPENQETRKTLASAYLSLVSATPVYELVLPNELELLPQVLDVVEHTLENTITEHGKYSQN
jgi:hypothetical protein